MEKSFLNMSDQQRRERKWFASLMWRIFPEATSEAQLADLVAEALNTAQRPVNPRTVRNWLRSENAPGLHYLLAVLALAGAETVFELFDPEQKE
ncbi:hypothetical protein JMM63_21580 [Rhodovulum sulfidophilum]|uniref:Uncharacterized protein n=2 Tax=Rhodovulum sulfidophilum TaxID=35806 RepID=A0ABS1S0I7_RHOSU|nr:hypothetical protein [Rhodovulum sulfidophilum]MBL3598104.1 hypothetical protein [Rhodovulum sulfidophilum]MBL3611302.1 hypothetical protein [Rhodovulum sulfidophilum]OLS52151.1 hypothetical protein BV392_09195 [Rhodovulum sulfidophilum]